MIARRERWAEMSPHSQAFSPHICQFMYVMDGIHPKYRLWLGGFLNHHVKTFTGTRFVGKECGLVCTPFPKTQMHQVRVCWIQDLCGKPDLRYLLCLISIPSSAGGWWVLLRQSQKQSWVCKHTCSKAGNEIPLVQAFVVQILWFCTEIFF